MTTEPHETISFHFLGSTEEAYLDGTVVIRDGQMILDIVGGYSPYLIVGKPRGHWFEGVNTTRGASQVEAKWASVCDTHVGIWIEYGDEYLFSFELPRA